MNPQELFCPMIACPARGQTGKGNIHIHSLKDKRCICDVCGQTFTTTKGAIFYRLRTNPEIVMCVIVLLAYGCPIQAIVKAFLLDERNSGKEKLMTLSAMEFIRSFLSHVLPKYTADARPARV